MKLYNILLPTLAIFALASCSSDNEPDNTPTALKITAGFETNSRALGSTWEADNIGVFAIAGNTKMQDKYKNISYSTTSTSDVAEFTADAAPIYFEGTEDITFCAYAPYESGATWNNPQVNTRYQVTREQQKRIDFIYATGAVASKNSPVLSFTGSAAFRHVMSRLVVKLKPGDGLTTPDVAIGGHYIDGLILDGTFDPATSIVTPTGSSEEWSLAYAMRTTDMTNNVVTFDALVIPQTLTAPLKYKAVMASQPYVNDTAMQPALEPGKTYTYTITIHKTGLKIEGCTVTDWEDGGSGSGEAVMQ